MFQRLDAWLGLRLFHPPIIWLCQRTGMSQYGLASYAWLAATFTLVERISFRGWADTLLACLISLMALISTVAAALNPDVPRRSSLGLRMLIWFFTALDAVRIVAHYRLTGTIDAGWSEAWDVFALIAEYAKTIVTIPPKTSRSRATSDKEVRA